MNYQPNRTIYKKDDGTVTHDSNGGKNTVAFIKGSPVSSEIAETLKLAELDAATDAREAEAIKEQQLARLKPATATESKVPKGTLTTTEAK